MKFICKYQVLPLISVFVTLLKANKSSLVGRETTKATIVDVETDTAESASRREILQAKRLSWQKLSFWPIMEKDKDLLLLEQILEDIEGGRGKSHRYKKFIKFMYPLFIGILVAKILLNPLILKVLTAISSIALVMGKISLITTGFLALKWIFSGNVYDTKDHFEFIYLPTSLNRKPYRSASGSFSLYDDQSWSDSNNHYMATAATVEQQKYIPVTLKHELFHRNDDGSRGGDASKTEMANSIKDLYSYSQHNYNKKNYNNLVGKPFL